MEPRKLLETWWPGMELDGITLRPFRSGRSFSGLFSRGVWCRFCRKDAFGTRNCK